jgi:putative FmdB family regulatory protein
MPTYEYKCSDNPEHKFTEIREISKEASRSTCAAKECNGKLLRIFSAPPITFNGTGFSKRNG